MLSSTSVHRGGGGVPSRSSPCGKLANDGGNERRCHRSEQGRVHRVFVLRGEVQQRKHSGVEECAGRECEGCTRVLEGGR